MTFGKAKFAIDPDSPLYTTVNECMAIYQTGEPIHYTFRLAHDVLVLQKRLMDAEDIIAALEGK